MNVAGYLKFRNVFQQLTTRSHTDTTISCYSSNPEPSTYHSTSTRHSPSEGIEQVIFIGHDWFENLADDGRKLGVSRLMQSRAQFTLMNIGDRS